MIKGNFSSWTVVAGVVAVLLVWYMLLSRPLFDLPYSTVILDGKSEVIGVKVASDGQFRFPPQNGLPLNYVQAVIAYEDSRFLFHPGVDVAALCRALYMNLKSGKILSGGSTLTMQVIRLSKGNPPRTLWEKFKEIVLSLRLESSCTKSEILALYAAHAPFGRNIVGLRAASLKYFGKRPEWLSWGEAALLAVLPNAPALLFPGRHTRTVKVKRNKLLLKIYRKGLMSEEDYRLAVNEPLPERLHEFPLISTHIMDNALNEHEGEVCPTFIDTELQRSVADIVERHMKMLSGSYIYNAAAVVAEVGSGKVRAYVGNAPPLPGSSGNMVDIIRSRRSSGSILKPALYALMLDKGIILPHSIVSDIPTRYGSYSPANFNHDYRGVVPASSALASSLNIPFLRMLKDYDYHRFYDELKLLGITTLDRDAEHYGLSLILGGAEVSLWDLCNMYRGFASVLRDYAEKDGDYTETSYRGLKLWDTIGEEERAVSVSRKPLISASALWFTLKALENVERPDVESGWKVFASRMDLAWKTGTSYGFRDAWAVGVNADWIVGVWVGNASGEGRPGLVGVRTAAPILFETASLLPVKHRFVKPEEEMRTAVVCRHSGFTASPICPDRDTLTVCMRGNRVVPCPYHKLIALDTSEKWRVNSDRVAVSDIRMKPWFCLSPSQEWYYAKSHGDYKRLPPWRPDCKPEHEEVMEFIYPYPGLKIFVPRDFEKKKETPVFAVAHRRPDATLYWYIDGRFMGKTGRIHQFSFALDYGSHRVSVTDEDGNTIKRDFEVVSK